MKKKISIIRAQSYNKGNFVRRNCRTEAMLTSNNMANISTNRLVMVTKRDSVLEYAIN